MATTTDGRGGRTALIIILVVALVAAVTYAAGLWNLDASGDLKAPEVDMSVSGGETPNVDLNTADIDVGTKTEDVKLPTVDVGSTTEQVKLPTVDVTPAEDDGKAEK